MAEQRAEIAAITAVPGPPTFDDTVVALERSGATLRRVSAVFFVLVGSLSTPGIRETEARVAPLLAAHADSITLDPALFARLDALHAARAELGLDPESLRLLERRHRDAVRAGARLDPAAQERLRALNAELSALSTEFGARLLADTNDAALVVDDPARLDGLSPDAVAAAARAAETRGHRRPPPAPARAAHAPARARLPHRPGAAGTAVPGVGLARRAGHRARHPRRRPADHRAACRAGGPARPPAPRVVGDRGGHRGRRSRWSRRCSPRSSRPRCATPRPRPPSWPPRAGHPIEPWDRAFHTEAVRRERAADTAALRPYLELERVLHHGVFAAAGELYGLQFTERHDLPGYHPDVRVFHVEDDGEPVGLFVADHYARETKRGGAWMNSFVVQSRLLGTRPVVLNTLNLTKPAAGPTLLTVAEVVTLFHEFGHALHGLLSDVRYPTFAGTGVPRDFVEFPSQVNEVWLRDPAIVDRYARHHETGEPLPDDLRARLIDQAPAFGEGFATTEYLAAVLLDLAWHRLAPGEEVADVEAFEAAALAEAGIPAELPPRYRSTYFNHVFAGAYSAAYYSYIWSEVLDADTVEWFAEHGGLRRENGDAFARALLSRGGAVDPMEAYRAFRGRDPEIGPLLARRGLGG